MLSTRSKKRDDRCRRDGQKCRQSRRSEEGTISKTFSKVRSVAILPHVGGKTPDLSFLWFCHPGGPAKASLRAAVIRRGAVLNLKKSSLLHTPTCIQGVSVRWAFSSRSLSTNIVTRDIGVGKPIFYLFVPSFALASLRCVVISTDEAFLDIIDKPTCAVQPICPTCVSCSPTLSGIKPLGLRARWRIFKGVLRAQSTTLRH